MSVWSGPEDDPRAGPDAEEPDLDEPLRGWPLWKERLKGVLLAALDAIH